MDLGAYGFAVIRQVGFSWFAWLADWTKEDGLCQAAGLSGESIQRLPCSANWKRETGIAEVEAIGIAEVYSHTYPKSVERPYDSVHHVGIIYNVTVGFLDLRFEQDGSTDRLRVVHRASSPVTATHCGGGIRS